tara:strand:+ start:10635 stop:10964 length:330 start_codon:yes stop_codon:yes gene_type:complete
MGCNCKKDGNGVKIKKTSDGKKDSVIIRAIILITKGFLFILGSVLTVIIVIPFSIYLLFKIIFLNEGVDVTDSLKSIGEFIINKKDKEEDEDDEYKFDEEDEFVLLDSE